MNKLLKIDNIMYKVADLEQAESFYVQVLGLRKVWEDPIAQMIGLSFANSDSEIVLQANPDLPEFDYSYLVNNVVDFCAEFKNAGYQVVTEPMAVRSGYYAVLADGDGNELPIIDLTKFGGQARYN
jgi:catechol 2,3-dioxygenase-like lactoylglutathione lyase family enzyme